MKLWLSVLQNIGNTGHLHCLVLSLAAPGLTLEWARQHADEIGAEHAPAHLGPVVALMISETDPAAT